jgi:hypothetical protein
MILISMFLDSESKITYLMVIQRICNKLLWFCVILKLQNVVMSEGRPCVYRLM